ncbi:MAG: hypothetical protein HZB55_13185 [Deltaproteobacteria bacterium]|nr:hypothetical protein [Deltaproteobacteria bacterium]
MTVQGSWMLLGAGWLAAVGVAAVAVLSLLSGLRSGRGLPASRRALLLAVRALALGAAAVAILRPARESDVVRPRQAPLAVLVDTSRSMTLGPSASASAVARWVRGARAAFRPLEAHYRAEFLGLGDPAPAVAPERLEGAEAFSGGTTPLGRTLEALARSRPDLAGVVVLSDGRDTERPGAPPAGLPFPVYPVVPDGGEVPDLRIDAVETPPVAFIRTPVEVRVRLGLSGFRGGLATVTLLEAGRPLRTETVRIDAKGAVVSLPFTPTRTGRRAYRVEVTPWPGDAAPGNNRAQFALNVVRDKTRVLLVAGTPTWDEKFLRRRLSRDPGVDLITFLILRTAEDVTSVPQDELSLIPFPTQELFGQELPSFDAVIFDNFDYGPYVPRQYLDNLVRYVRENGGGFALLGGDRSFALGGYVGTPLEDVLPLELSGAAPGREYLPARFRPRLTPAGVTHPLFQWRPRVEENRALWNSLPELEGMNWVLRAKPGAVVLAENPEVRNEYGPLPVVALGEYGAGRTLAVATDGLWRWALPAVQAGGDDTAYRDLWTRVLRWLVHDPEMELVRLSLPPGPLRAGEAVRLRARVLDRSYSPAAGAAVSGSVIGEAGRRTPLRWKASAPGEYVSDPVDLAAEGLWAAEVEARQGEVSLGRDRAEFAVEPRSPEGLRLGVDRAYLEALARGSSGRAFPLGGDSLFAFLAEKGRGQVEVVGRKVEEVWAQGAALLAALVLFGLDWALRRFWE